MSGTAGNANGRKRNGKGSKVLSDAEVAELRRLLKVKPEDIGKQPNKPPARPRSSGGSKIPEDVNEWLDSLLNRD